jgi:phage minor structural protein
VGFVSFPILYKPTETNFNHNGIGILSDCLSCEVSEERNGEYELTMLYRSDGIHFDDIVDRAIIRAKPDPYRDYQLFRVYAKSKPLMGVVTINAAHISYDLSGIPVSPFTVEGVQAAMKALKDNAVIECPFTFWTDKGTIGLFEVKTPASIRAKLGDGENSILGTFSAQSGEFEFDNFDVKFHGQRGKNRGLSIRYGKNLTDFKQDENCSNVYTGVYPYWVGTDKDGNDLLIQLDEKIVNAAGEYDFRRIMVLDVTSLIEEKEDETLPTQDEIRAVTKKYIEDNNIGIPEVSLTISYINLEKSSEYNPNMIEEASLCDFANVEFPQMKVSTTAQIVKTVYDVILERYKSITLGTVKKNIADTIVAQNKKINQIIGG